MSEGNNKRCTICNSIVFEDGTAEDCLGECERELNEERGYTPLSFDEDNQVIRELPELEPEIDYSDEEYPDC